VKWVKVSTNHAWATFWIQVPLIDTTCPAKNSL